MNRLSDISKSIFFLHCRGLQVLIVLCTVLGDEKSNRTVRLGGGLDIYIIKFYKFYFIFFISLFFIRDEITNSRKWSEIVDKGVKNSKNSTASFRDIQPKNVSRISQVLPPTFQRMHPAMIFSLWSLRTWRAVWTSDPIKSDKKNRVKSLSLNAPWVWAVPELEQWQAAWCKTRVEKKTASRICPLRLAMGTPPCQLRDYALYTFFFTAFLLDNVSEILQQHEKSPR